jgi:hypothetical protein
MGRLWVKDFDWLNRPFHPGDPDGSWLMDELKKIAGKGKALRCCHCREVVPIEKIVAERQEYCKCGAAWYMDGSPVRMGAF